MINIELPPLRERISRHSAAWPQHFLARVCEDAGKQVRGFTDEALAALQRYRWPGNVRELQNVVERAVLLGKGDQVRLEDLPPQVCRAAGRWRRAADRQRTLKEALAGPERQIILEVLEAQQLEPQRHGRRAGHQPHDALQEDEAAGADGAGRTRPASYLLPHASCQLPAGRTNTPIRVPKYEHLLTARHHL